jgi:GH25 family lysozyme M1 (1,4-beta-N-acetylmuramidase)/LysM repeat protein
MEEKIADLSKYQPLVNYAKAKADGLSLAILRVQYGSTVIDQVYPQHVSGCVQNAIPFGSYAFGHYVSVNDAVKEATDFLSRIDKRTKFLVLDVESQTLQSCGSANLASATQAFINECKKAGYKTGLYVSPDLATKYGMDKVVADFLWIPRYSSNDLGLPTGPKPLVPCDLWQYTQCGKLDGVPGHVDLSLLVGSKDLSWFVGQTTVPADTKPAPKPVASAPTSGIAPYVPENHGILAKVKVIADKLNIRVAPNVKADITRVALKGEVFDVYANVNDWHNVGGANWVFGNNGQYLELVHDAPKPVAPKPVFHKVVSGDTLSELAVTFNTTVSAIKQLNGLKSDNIYIGQSLRVK